MQLQVSGWMRTKGFENKEREKKFKHHLFSAKAFKYVFRLACGRFLRNCSQKKCDKFGMSGEAGTSNRALMLSGHHENGVLQLIMIPLLEVFVQILLASARAAWTY